VDMLSARVDQRVYKTNGVWEGVVLIALTPTVKVRRDTRRQCVEATAAAAVEIIDRIEGNEPRVKDGAA
jgi:hypothetical protein